MVWYQTFTLMLLLHTVVGLPRGKVTEKPQAPNDPKHPKAPPHISDFTDPDTGLNPFLDIEEGQTSMGRNIMEDEIRDDTPYFDLVEGDAANRRWGFPETVDKAPTIGRWPAVDYKDDFPIVTTPLNLPPAELTERPKAVDVGRQMKGKQGTKAVTQSTLIYVSASIVTVVTIILLVGACWWRRKLKVPATRVESADTK